MTDVRLTIVAEDGQVYPVLGNTKGELKLEEPTLASDDYVAKTGDNMTGDLTLGTDKITLDATDGSASFASDAVQIQGSSGQLYWDQPTGFLAMYGQRSGTGTFAITSDGQIRLGGADPTDSSKTNILLEGDDGSAEFAGDVTSSNGTNLATIGSSGNANFKRGGVGLVALNGFASTSFGIAITDDADISSSADYKTYLFSDGRAEFAGDVVVGSRNKKWMLVESNGLCHMVEQSRASTADLVAPAAAEYPPLRDVFAELNAIESALAQVMEKLRMTPPAGWEVWDGSSENS